ncbi:MAG: DUF418 domain-containing protein [Actinomycetota bacterium]|nr:DUF418 domain-containing protein [Actinomycetota bacterium]
MTESTAAPSAPRTRDTLPDLLRGVALLGIVVVNAPYLGISAEGFSVASVASTLDAAVAFAVIALAQGKFYLLFSFLFGYSLSYVLRDDRPQGRTRYRRRLVVLAVLGVAHAVLLFVGDILLTYALLGALLLRFSRSDVPRLLRASRITFAIGAGLLVVVLGLAAAFPEEAAGTDPAVVAYDASMATATFTEATMLRLDGLPSVLGAVVFAQAPLAFAAFLLGLAAARRRLLAEPGAHVDLWRRLTRIGIGAGLPLQLVAAALQVSAIRAGTPYATTGSLGVMLGFVTAPLLSAGYLGLLAGRLARDPGFMRWSWPAGRMSLTVYLGQSVLLMLAFSGTGLGLFGSLGTASVVAIGIGTWVVLTVFAALWLRRSDRGPLESVVARLTTPRVRPDAAPTVEEGRP